MQSLQKFSHNGRKIKIVTMRKVEPCMGTVGINDAGRHPKVDGSSTWNAGLHASHQWLRRVPMV